ncbi:MAG: PIN domain-containing protein [Planctomycetes bacterium]|nr:PIN domain-containing protein [Planctomycetota bacterium]
MVRAAADAIFVDTNVLVAANVVTHPKHSVALSRLKELAAAGAELWISRQVLREYLSVLTRPQTFSTAQPITALIPQIDYFQARMLVAEDNVAVTAKLLELLLATSAGGKHIHDANIVATMLVNGVTQLLTDNIADFKRFEAVVRVVPLSVVLEPPG